MTKRILFVSHSTNFAGAEQYLYDLISSFDSSCEYKVYVCCPYIGDSSLYLKLLALKDVEVVIINYKWALFSRVRPLRMFVNLFNQFFSSFKLARYIKKNRIAIVYSNTSVILCGALAAFITGTHHIWSIHESINDKKFIFGLSSYRWLLNKCAAKVIFNSESIKSEFKILGQINSEIIYNGLDFDNYESQVEDNVDSITLAENLINKQEFYLGCVGSIAEHKQQLELIKAMPLLLKVKPLVKLRLIGQVANVDYKNKCDAYIVENNLQEYVEFIDFMDQKSEIYSFMDILIVPSAKEPFGRVVVEGLFFKKIVIAANVGGIPEIIVSGNNGILINDCSGEAIARTVLKTIEDKELLTTLYANGKISILKYSLVAMVEKNLKIIDSMFKPSNEVS
ncbi:MAG: glycosyltransferase family 4 protein [Candidatus Omnitrophica bacterium]|nr:glycosyltransferase family 4 protein [Candidatus Omnitrophota bacterium]